MSVIDMLISVIVLIGVYRGYQSGFIQSLAKLISWLAALIIASRVADDFAPLFTMIDNPVLQIAASFVVVMVIIVLGVQMTASVVLKAVRALKLGFLDKLLGMVLGAMTGLLKVLMVLSVSATLLVKLPAWENSPLAQNLLPFAPLAGQMLQKAFGETLNQLDNPYNKAL